VLKADVRWYILWWMFAKSWCEVVHSVMNVC